MGFTQVDLYIVAGIGMLCIGLHGLILRPHLLQKVIALNVAGAGSFIALVSIARRVPGDTPDPLPHAMVLTGIVVTVAMTALAITLAKRVVSETGASSFEELEADGD